MRKIIFLLIPFLIASCGTAYRNSGFEGFSNTDYRCFQIDGSTNFENGGDNINIYLGSVKRRGSKSWTPSLYTRSNTDPFPYSGYAAGFTFNSNKVLKVKEVTVSFNEEGPIAYKPLKVKPGRFDFKIGAEEDYWVPPSFPVDGDKAPELARGKYRLWVRYLADGREREAHWDLIYRPGLHDVPPKMPICSTRKEANMIWLATQRADQVPWWSPALSQPAGFQHI